MGKPKSSDIDIPCIFDYMESNKTYREYLIDELCTKIPNTSDFRDMIEYVVDHKVDYIKANLDNIDIYMMMVITYMTLFYLLFAEYGQTFL